MASRCSASPIFGSIPIDRFWSGADRQLWCGDIRKRPLRYAIPTRMNSLTQKPNHTYSAEFRLYGELLDPLEVSSIIGLQATTWSNGELIGKRQRLPFWGYNGCDDPQFQAEWQSLEDALALVSRRLKPYRSIIADLSGRFHGIWWCGHFQSSFDGGPTLSPRVLADVASFGCPLYIDNYYHDGGGEFQEIHAGV